MLCKNVQEILKINLILNLIKKLMDQLLVVQVKVLQVWMIDSNKIIYNFIQF
jgi:hypothetical protein